jgi:hypothetical protein
MWQENHCLFRPLAKATGPPQMVPSIAQAMAEEATSFWEPKGSMNANREVMCIIAALLPKYSLKVS